MHKSLDESDSLLDVDVGEQVEALPVDVFTVAAAHCPESQQPVVILQFDDGDAHALRMELAATLLEHLSKAIRELRN